MTLNNPNIINVSVARKIIYGTDAIKSLPEVCDELELRNVWIVTGGTATKKIREKTIIPILESVKNLDIATVEIGRGSYTGEIDQLQSEFSSFKQKRSVNPYSKDVIFAAGGGRVMDIVKVVSNFTGIPWISIPTSASHDGFSSPFINFLLREAIKDIEKSAGTFKPSPPLAIVGDTNLIAKSPYKHLISGVGDLIAKHSANLDWKLAMRVRGDYYDEYAATFGQVSARIVEEGFSVIAQGSEPGVRLVTKALGNSGVAMSIAGNSRPASGSEHLISHYLDYIAEKEKSFSTEKTTHGFQVGLSTILALYLHGENWKTIKSILEKVKHPITFNEIGIDREILLQAMINAHKIRPDRYTILGEGLNKKAALNAIETTGVA